MVFPIEWASKQYVVRVAANMSENRYNLMARREEHQMQRKRHNACAPVMMVRA